MKKRALLEQKVQPGSPPHEAPCAVRVFAAVRGCACLSARPPWCRGSAHTSAALCSFTLNAVPLRGCGSEKRATALNHSEAGSPDPG